jgi:hypothetical protein
MYLNTLKYWVARPSITVVLWSPDVPTSLNKGFRYQFSYFGVSFLGPLVYQYGVTERVEWREQL